MLDLLKPGGQGLGAYSAQFFALFVALVVAMQDERRQPTGKRRKLTDASAPPAAEGDDSPSRPLLSIARAAMPLLVDLISREVNYLGMRVPRFRYRGGSY
jgi:hypothetical protein